MSSKIRGNLVTAVAWNSSNTSERFVVIWCAERSSWLMDLQKRQFLCLISFSYSNTAPILIGTSRGVIFETELDSGEDRIFNTGLESSFRQGSTFFLEHSKWKINDAYLKYERNIQIYLINTLFHIISGIRHRKRAALANHWIRVSSGAAH